MDYFSNNLMLMVFMYDCYNDTDDDDNTDYGDDSDSYCDNDDDDDEDYDDDDDGETLSVKNIILTLEEVNSTAKQQPQSMTMKAPYKILVLNLTNLNLHVPVKGTSASYLLQLHPRHPSLPLLQNHPPKIQCPLLDSLGCFLRPSLEETLY